MRAACLLLGVLCLLPACGGSGPNRPEVVDTFPADRQVLDAPIGVIRLTYDDEVRVLNPDDADVRINDVPIAVRIVQHALEPCCVYLFPRVGSFFPSGSFLVVHVERGAVINADEHYPEEEFIYAFTSGSVPVYLGRGGVVTEMDQETLAIGADIPTPGGRTAMGIQTMAPNNTPRVFVQLADGGGAREALAHFTPGDAAMTPIALSTSTGAGDLTTTARCIVPGTYGRFLYAAFRDATRNMVRLFRIDAATGTESAALELSIPASPDTRPLGLAIDDARNLLLVACADGATGRQAYVDVAAFIEFDRYGDVPGIQAFELPEGAGPIEAVDDQGVIAAPLVSTLTFTRTSSNSSAQSFFDPVGTGVDVLRTADFEVLLQPLTNYVDQMGLITRTNTNGYFDPAVIAISDDVGAGSTLATGVTAMAPYPSDNRFLMTLDTDVLTRWVWTGIGFDQEDLNGAVDNIQGLDLSASAPGVTTISRTQGAFPSAP